MPVTHLALATNDQIASVTAGSPDTVYTATGVKACVTACTASNGAISNARINVYLLPSGATPTSDMVIATLVVPAYSTVIVGDILGHVVPVGGTIKAYSDVASAIRLTVSGFEIS